MNGIRAVILGFLSRSELSGYEIKQKVDHTTRFFWAASYGQIYPELRRLEEEGLVVGRASPRGQRARTVYRVTSAGRAELRRWLEAPEATTELRDVGLLKVFFADLGGRAGMRAAVRGIRQEREATLERLRAIRERWPGAGGAASPDLALDYGIGIHEWTIDWCRRAERRLSRKEESP